MRTKRTHLNSSLVFIYFLCNLLDEEAGSVGWIRQEEAREKVLKAGIDLDTHTKQDKIVTTLDNTHTIITREIDAPVDINTLKKFIANPMSLTPHGKQNTTNHIGMHPNDTHRNPAFARSHNQKLRYHRRRCTESGGDEREFLTGDDPSATLTHG